jgi:hypothetical protein
MVGKFQLVSSEGLDDYLKALGVGFARRKLAATISPTIFISIEENGIKIIFHGLLDVLDVSIFRPLYCPDRDERVDFRA